MKIDFDMINDILGNQKIVKFEKEKKRKEQKLTVQRINSVNIFGRRDGIVGC